MRVNAINNQNGYIESDIESRDTSQSTIIEVYEIENSIPDTSVCIENCENYIYTDEYKQVSKILFYCMFGVIIPPIPFLDIYYAYKYEDMLNKYAYNIDINIQNCLLVSGFFSYIIIKIIIFILIINFVNKTFLKKNEVFYTTFIIVGYLIISLFMISWYLIESIILIGTALNDKTHGFDSNLATYLIITPIIKLAVSVSANIILRKS